VHRVCLRPKSTSILAHERIAFDRSASTMLPASVAARRGASALLSQQSAKRCLSSTGSRFSSVPLGPPDPILGVTEAFKADPSTIKINLGVGAYRDDAGHPYVLPSVRVAERRLVDAGHDMEYLPVSGLQSFVKKALVLAYSLENAYLKDGNVAALQTLSGTGACRIAGEFLARFGSSDGEKPLVLMPSPTWGNHHAIFRDAGCDIGTYAYYDPATKLVDIESLVASLRKAPAGSTVLLHATAHNPTGADPTHEQWAAISAVIKEKGHTPLFDSAYQGFTSGNTDVDATSIRMFVNDGHRSIMLAQSFSKNMGLYGHRVGCFSILTDSKTEAKAIDSQLKIIARALWSNPPLTGAFIAAEILGDPKLDAMWRQEVLGMANRINLMRSGLQGALEATGSSLDWSHITKQAGMFCFSGLSADAVAVLAKEHSVYLTSNGRISMAGLSDGNIDYLANAIHHVTK
jgi:aspartate aminotransferase, mitochondrial